MDFRRPDVLDPDYVDLNARHVPAEDLVLTPSSTTLEERLRQACEYGRTLWDELAEVRRYLRDDVGGAGSGDGSNPEPSMLGDEASWRTWAGTYAGVCSALAGMSGDSGFGQSEATLIARAHGVELGQLG